MSISQPDELSCALPHASGSPETIEKAGENVIWKLTLAYDGTDFHGWQIQPDPSAAPTIQGALADAIATVTGERVLPQGSGRTDAGVHAAAQVASFPLAIPIPPENFLHALNRLLPPAIRVITIELAPPGFHARRSAIGKIYRYQVFQGSVCSPFLTRYVTRPRWPLDFAAMQQAAHLIQGEHDFTSFAASDPDRTTRLQRLAPTNSSQEMTANIRRIDQSVWSCAPLTHNEQIDPSTNTGLPDVSTLSQEAAQIFTYTIRGNGFLHHMVRNLVGTFFEVGRGHIPPSAITEILQVRNRSMAGPTAPAPGLCLIKVLY